MSGEARTQKTEIGYLDTTFKKIPNVADGGEVGPQADDIDSTNFDSDAMEFLTGLANNGEMTLQINLDPQDAVHQQLADEAGSGNRFPFWVGLSDGTALPTVVSGALVPPLASARTSYTFLASIKSFREAFKKNDIVRVNVTIKLSGGITRIWHT
jgi:hypothetical protein